MKRTITSLFVLLFIHFAQAQSISGIINTYTRVDSINTCTNTVHVASAAGFGVGDRVLIIQMKGADVNLTNTASFGNINAYNGAGFYEFGNISTITGTAIKMVNAIERSFDPTGKVQLIRVPQYTNASVDALLTAQDWNGTTGGVVVFETNTLTLNADIDVSGKGFKGGDAGNFPSSCPTGTGTSLYYSDTLSGKGGEKGEGIVVLSNGYLACRGKAVNGGGGGNDHNAGGAGGSNGNTAGVAGENDEAVFSCPGSPGFAAIALDQTMASDRLFLGGGGGAGHGNNTNGTSGGDGGGLIIIKATSIDGNAHSIISNGITITEQAWGDGAGGGGAGGSIVISATTVIETSLIAKGGKGGDTGADQCTGPGGGGSGGVIKHSGATLWPGITTDLSGGTFGTNTTATSPCFGISNGAAAGLAGITVPSLILAQEDIPYSPDFANAGPDVQVCTGSSVTLGATGGVSYVWSPATYLDNPLIANPVCTPLADITYTVTVTSANGCTDTDNIFVDKLPPVPANAGADVSVCSGSSITMNATGGVSYVWSPATYLDNPFISNPICTPLTAITYTVTVTDANGCTGTDNVHVSVNTSDFLTTVPDVTVCSGGSVTLTASGASVYLWTPSTYLDDATSATPLCTPLMDIIYTVIGHSTLGCWDTAYVNVTVTIDDFLTVSPDVSICEGGTIDLAASGGVAYTWTPATYLDDPFSATPTCTPLTDITYIVIAEGVSGCNDIDTVNVFVNPSDFLTVTPGASVCIGGSVDLSASGGSTYLWTPSTYLDDPTSATPTCTPDADITYTVISTNASGCTDYETVSVDVFPGVDVTAGPDTTICYGGQFKLYADGGVEYLWSPSTYLDNPGIADPTCNPFSDITYVVYVTDINGCTGTDTVDIIVNAPPTIVACDDIEICRGDTVTLTVTGGITYTWTPEPLFGCGTCASMETAPTSTTTYSVVGTDANGCSGSDEVTVTVTICDAIENIYAGLIHIYPNPASDYLIVEVPAAFHDAEISVINILGETIPVQVEKNAEGFLLHLGQLAPQELFIRLSNKEEVVVKVVTIADTK